MPEMVLPQSMPTTGTARIQILSGAVVQHSSQLRTVLVGLPERVGTHGEADANDGDRYGRPKHPEKYGRELEGGASAAGDGNI